MFQTKKVKIDFSFSISCIALINTQPTFFFCLNIYLRLGSLGKRFQDLCANVHWGYSQVQLCGEWGVKDMDWVQGRSEFDVVATKAIPEEGLSWELSAIKTLQLEE